MKQMIATCTVSIELLKHKQHVYEQSKGKKERESLELESFSFRRCLTWDSRVKMVMTHDEGCTMQGRERTPGKGTLGILLLFS